MPANASTATNRSPAPRICPTTPSTARRTITSWVTPRLLVGDKKRQRVLGRAAAQLFLPPLAVAPATSAAAVTAAARPLLLGRSRRGVLGPLDQLFGRDEGAVLVLGDKLQA